MRSPKAPLAASQEQTLINDAKFLWYLFMGSLFGKELMILMSVNHRAWLERPLREVSEEHLDIP